MLIWKNILFILFRLNCFKSSDYAWVIHPISDDDIFKRYKFLSILPKGIVYSILKTMPPLVLSEVFNFKDYSGRSIRGYMIACFLLPEMINGNKKLVENRLFYVAKMCHKFGISILGIGGIMSVSDVLEKQIYNNYKIILTNGGSLAAFIIKIRLNKFLADIHRNIDDVSVSILNACSTKGSVISKYISKLNFKDILLIDTRYDKLVDLQRNIGQNVKLSIDFEDIKKTDIVIITPGYKRIEFRDYYFKDNMVIYDISDPHYDFSVIQRKYNNISILYNGLINTSKINYNIDLGIPRNDSFVCLAETFLLARMNEKRPNYYHQASLVSVDFIEKSFRDSGFFLEN